MKNYSKNDVDLKSNEPINYTKSMASKWHAKDSRRGTNMDRLWYEPGVILFSLGIFMVYFCILREENHVDQELGRTLYSRISGLEEYQLRMSLKYNREHGKSTKDIEERLKDLEQQKKSS